MRRRIFTSSLLLLACALSATARQPRAKAATATPILDVSDDKFRFATFPGGNPPPQTFRILNRGDGTLNLAVSVPAQFPWLKVSLSGLTGTISITASLLPEGNYTGAFLLSDPAAADSPREIEVKLHVTARVVTEPERLDFFLPAGRSAFRDVWLPVQSVPSGVLPGYRASTDAGGNWLDLQLLPEAGIYLRAKVKSALPEGTYTGSIEFEHRGQPTGRTPVSLTVTSKAILAADRDKISVQTSPGLEVPDEWLFIRNDGTGPLAWTPAARTDDGANWLLASQQDGALKVSFSTAGLNPGRYRGTVEVRSDTAANAPLAVPVELRVLARGRPEIPPGAAVDAASYCDRPPVNCYLAPGSLVTLFGSQLAYGTAAATRLPLPTRLGATRVLVNGAPAELLYVSYGQVNFRLPEAPPPAGRWFIQAERDGQTSSVITARHTTAAPFVFTANQTGSGYGSILNAGTSKLADSNSPAPRGGYVEIYGTGLGKALTSKPTVLFYGPGIVGNIEVEASYAGPAPGFAGLDQVNVQIPANVPPGDHVHVQIRTPLNLLSNIVEIAVR